MLVSSFSSSLPSQTLCSLAFCPHHCLVPSFPQTTSANRVSSLLLNPKNTCQPLFYLTSLHRVGLCGKCPCSHTLILDIISLGYHLITCSTPFHSPCKRLFLLDPFRVVTEGAIGVSFSFLCVHYLLVLSSISTISSAFYLLKDVLIYVLRPDISPEPHTYTAYCLLDICNSYLLLHNIPPQNSDSN